MKITKKSLPLLSSHIRLTVLGVVSLALVGGAILGGLKIAAASTCSSITDCQQQIANDKNAVGQLQNQATSYQDAIDHLNAQIDQLQVVIDANVAQQQQLQQQIADDQAQIDQEKAILGTDIKAMYVDGAPTTIEQLASSKDLSDFVDKQEYRTAVQNKLQDTVVKIAALQQQQQQQKVQVDALLQQQRDQQAQVASAQAQQQQMLSYNQSQQDSYNSQTASNQQKLNALIAAQRTANNSVSAAYYFIRFPGAIQNDPMNSSYPYSGWPFSMSTAPGCVDGDGPDQWGYCTRQCVSYAAWAVAASGRGAPIGWGNAKDWVGAARSSGIPIYTSDPQPGDVAIDTAGTWGHAMYVEAVNGNQIFVSQYNQQLTGTFSTQWRRWE